MPPLRKSTILDFRHSLCMWRVLQAAGNNRLHKDSEAPGLCPMVKAWTLCKGRLLQPNSCALMCLQLSMS